MNIKRHTINSQKQLFFLLFLPVIGFGQMENVTSRLELYDITTNSRKLLYEENDHFEAPNWSRDGNYVLINSRGKLYRYDLETGIKTGIPTDFADKLNNDHGISPDGTQLVISHHDQTGTPYGEGDFRSSRIYLAPITGGIPRAVTPKTPPFWHGWSPDGKTLVYTALREDNFDIYAIPVAGGKEVRLTDDPGLDDGPEYSPDGAYIYYNSMQSGKMELWRMRSDGSEKTQLTKDAFSNWFPHPSPDGKYLVYIAYLEDLGSAHPPMKQVALRLMDLKEETIITLCEFTGGQGTINVPSWAPDSKRFAFVSYSYTEE
ncbi:MAG: transporter [Bacteroidota bacterium]